MAQIDNATDIFKTGTPAQTIYYIDKLTQVVEKDSQTQYCHYLGDYALLTQTHDNTAWSYQLHFLHKDRLDSVATLTDTNNHITERRGFDPFGQPRH